MSIVVTHSKVSGAGDSGDSALVQPSDWNANHVLVGLGNSAGLDVGIEAGTVAAGDHTHTSMEYLRLANVVTAPTTVVNTGALYMQDNALKFIGPTGVVTILVPAP